MRAKGNAGNLEKEGPSCDSAGPIGRTLRLVALAVLIVPLAGCLFGGSEEKDSVSSPLENKELMLLMRSFSRDFSSTIETASNRVILDSSESPEAQRRILVWKMRTIPLAQSFLIVEDARIAFVDLWALTQQVRLSSQSTEAEEHFGSVVGELAGRMDRLNVQIRRIGSTFLTEQELDETERSIEKFAGDSQIGERFFAYHRSQPDAELGSFLTGMVSKPLSALNPFGGVGETAVAIHDVAGSADLFRDAVVEIPDELRWQSELIIHDLRNSPELQRTLASVESLTQSTADFRDIARDLPQELRNEVGALLEEAGEAQDDLRVTLKELGDTLDKVDPLLTSTEEVTESVATAAAALEKTLVAFDASMVTILGTPEAREAAAARRDPNAPSEPFRILDYAEVAVSVTATAEELRSLLEELNQVTESGRIAELAATAEQTTTGTVDHLVLRLGQLILVLTGCALLLRLLWGRLDSSRTA
ncbi:MAG: hypothetical protein ACI8X5_004158 [Planctomycetota bacterium]|jgi:hypothetical protein